jgi:hypothetical protein
MENEVRLVGYVNVIHEPIKKTLKETNVESKTSSNTEWIEYPFVIGVKRGEKSIKWDNIYCISKKPISRDLEKELVEVKGSLRVDSWKDENGEYKNKWFVVVYSVINKLDDLKDKVKEVLKKE